MNNNLYFSMISLKRKYVVLLLIQAIFLSGMGYGVYTYDQYYPDLPVDGAVFESITTPDQAVHWISLDIPADIWEYVPSIDSKVSYDINSMNLDNKISSFTLFKKSINQQGSEYGQDQTKLLQYGNDLLFVISYSEFPQFPVIFKISNQFTNPQVEMSVVKLPHLTGYMDLSIDEQTGNLLFSSVDIYLWGLWMDLYYLSVSHDQFRSLLPQKHINSSTYLTEVSINDLNWKTINNDLPVDTEDWYTAVSNLPEWQETTTIDQSVYMPSYHRKVATKTEDIDADKMINLVANTLVTPVASKLVTQIPGLYKLVEISTDTAGRVHGQGLSATSVTGQFQIHYTDYYIIDPAITRTANNTGIWRWDIVDNPGITLWLDKVSTKQVDDLIYYLNTDTNLDIRSSDDYDQIRSSNHAFLSWYYSNAKRNSFQLGWFDPLDPSSRTNLTESGTIGQQPQHWVDIANRNIQPGFNSRSEAYLIRNTQYPLIPHWSVESRLISYIANEVVHLHFSFQDIPVRYEDNTDGMSLYSWDMSLSELDPSNNYPGTIKTLREPEGNVEDRLFVKNGFLGAIGKRINGEKTEILYFYHDDYTIKSNTRNFVMIVEIGGTSDE